MSETLIKAEHLSKYYRLGVINNGTLFRDIQTWMALKHGKQDPHSTIGSHKYDSGLDGFWALENLDFEIRKGDRVGILGKNGAGKSTLLKILSRITAPTEGSVKIKGRIASLLEVGTGFHAELTGRENIYLNGAILGMKRHEVSRKLDEIIAFSEIEKHIDTPVKRYSSGMYVRLAFAVAAHLDSEILIADEVLAVGDAAFQKKALGKMNDLSTGEGRTVLFVSHNMSQVKRLCNRGIILEKGHIIRQDDNIDKSVSWYQGTDENGGGYVTTIWKNDGSFTDENFSPVEFCIVDDNDTVVTDALDYEKEYRLKLMFDIEKPDSNVDFWISVYRDTEMVLRINMPDNYGYKTGLNTVYAPLRKKTFLPGKYILSLGASLKNTRWIVNSYNMEITSSFQINGSIANISLFE